jgi:tape measure domain-containing protein
MAEDLGVALLRLGTDQKAYDRGINRAEKGAKRLEKRLKLTEFAAKQLKRALIGVGVSFNIALIALSVGIIKVSASFEQMALQLDILTKGKGVETLDRINKWALNMPINTAKAVKAFVTMQAFGLDPTIKKLQTLTDVAIIFGEDALRAVSRALGQMKALGKVSAEELNQLSEVGLNARKILADTFGMTVEQLQKSRVTMDEVLDALFKGMTEKFGGAAEKGMNTWQGLTSITKSYITELLRLAGEGGLFDFAKSKISDINEVLEDWITNNTDLIEQKVHVAIGLINAALSTLLVTIQALGIALPTVVRLLSFLGKVFGPTPNPFGAPRGKSNTRNVAQLSVAIKALTKQQKIAIATFVRMKQAALNFSKSFADSMVDLVSGAQTSFKEILRGWIIMLAKMAARFAAQQGLQSLFSRISPAPGAAPGKLVSGLASIGKIFGFEKGGIVPGPTGAPVPAIVHGGEEITPPGKQGSGAGVVQNINISPGLPETVRAEITKFFPEFAQIAVNAIESARGRGGSMAGAMGAKT